MKSMETTVFAIVAVRGFDNCAEMADSAGHSRKNAIVLIDDRRGPAFEALDFIQRCQTTFGAFLAQDLATELSALWTCLERVPRNRPDRETAMAAAGVCALAHCVFERVSVRSDGLRQRSARSTATLALELIRTRFRAGDLSLTGLARDLHVSHTSLSRSFASHTGHSFSAHVNGLRVLAAVRLLVLRELQVSGVATAVGYISTRELDRQFHKWFGLPPKRFARLLGLLPAAVVDGLCGPRLRSAGRTTPS